MVGWIKNFLPMLLPEGIRTRLFLLIALVLLPLVLLLGWIYYERYDTLRHRELQSQLEVAEVIAANFLTYTKSIHNQSLITGKAILSFDIYTQSKAESILTEASDRYQGIRNMSWVAIDGTVLASSVRGFAGRSLGHRPYFQRVVKEGHWSIGDVTETGTITPTPTVAIATAVSDDMGILRGIIVAGIEPSLLSESILVKMRPADAAYTVFDSRGVVVFRCPEIPLSWQQRTDWIQQDTLLQRSLQTGKAYTGQVQIDAVGDEVRLSARVPIAEIGWVAGTGRSETAAFATIWKSLLQDAAFAAMVSGCAFLLAYLFSTTISNPIRHLQADAQKMGQGKIDHVKDTYAPYELQNLREQVEDMADDLITRARQLGELTNDLKTKNEELESIISITSHDLKSPVVNIMGFSGELSRSLNHLKEALLESHVSECKSRDIMTVLDTEIPEEVNFIQKSTRSIDQMLQSLAKVVHIVLTEVRVRRVNVNSLLTSLLTQFENQIQESHVEFTVEPVPDCQADPELLKEILFNLIENAILYQVPGRAGKVMVGGYTKSQYVIYFVKDNGRGIDPAHQHNIFKLFHKLDVSEQGEGIGLTVSKRLIERQSGNLWVESEPGVGSTFFIALPKA